ncbi:unnamed protein product [Trichogramma brassicae]|uniref:Uncharacterized protein n=1 Tax=Trichogramma brassicae TaxID=86971 RepID=A0A6H5ISQ4_9HYME|nr:unnamed protein product [Trichogramma brassicae]
MDTSRCQRHDHHSWSLDEDRALVLCLDTAEKLCLRSYWEAQIARGLFGEDKTFNCVGKRVQQLLSPAFAHRLLAVLAGIDESQATRNEEQFPLFLKARRKWLHHAVQQKTAVVAFGPESCLL